MLFRFAGISIEELYANRDPARRATLLNSCRKLQEGKSDCICPQDQVLTLLIEAHVKDPAHFDWTLAEVISPEYMHEISIGEVASDEELIAEHCEEHRKRLKRFECMFSPLRAELQSAFDADGETRPKTHREFLDFLEKSDQKLLTGLCKGTYERVAGTGVSKELFLQFLEVCPPFRAFNHAMHMANYDRSVRHKNDECFKSGANDLFMAICLPYCNIFVTNDRKQGKCLREIASVSGLETEVVFYDDFCDSLN